TYFQRDSPSPEIPVISPRSFESSSILLKFTDTALSLLSLDTAAGTSVSAAALSAITGTAGQLPAPLNRIPAITARLPAFIFFIKLPAIIILLPPDTGIYFYYNRRNQIGEDTIPKLIAKKTSPLFMEMSFIHSV